MLSYPGEEWLGLQWHVPLVSNAFLKQMTNFSRGTSSIYKVKVVSSYINHEILKAIDLINPSVTALKMYK